MNNSGRVQIITTGGTIASLPRENGDVIATLNGDEFIRRMGVNGNIEISESVKIGSFGFNYETLRDVALDVVNALSSPEVVGVVVTHGTDTMEETAFYLSITTSHIKKPVILTGAQLDASYMASDGANNLRDAICAAQVPALGEGGALISFAGFLYNAREVTKIDTTAIEAFESLNWGPIGRIDKDDVWISRRLSTKTSMKIAVPSSVALIRLAVGMTGEEVRKMAQGYPGVVLQAFGRGNAHPSVSDEVRRLVENGVPVIVTSRCMRGSVRPVYGNGGGKDLERAGAWFAGDLSGEKARVLLGLMISNQIHCDEMIKILGEYSHP
ncbi:asparaginase [Alicyclobacillus dauci]|uniref:asparaginase n=1 Tax=Alicyclobacillus dauci TaxID=1475485 RepID=A0ABY6Z0S2_9BACL|nr:asparaginase [Alicyclobacillus dauci]WAH36465.1 asparaginase [Alicyclobacillus dauci]